MASNRFAESARTIGGVVRRAQPSVAWLSVSAACFLAVGAIGALPPLFTARIIDALGARDAAGALRALGGYAALTIAGAGIQFASSYATSAFREGLVRNLRLALVAKLHRARLDEVEKLSLGEIANRLTADIESLCSQLQFSVAPAIQGIVTILITACVMLSQDVVLALVSFAFIALLLVPVRIVTPHLRSSQREISSIQDAVYGAINERAGLSALTLLRNVKAAAREQRALGLIVDALCRARMHQTVISDGANLVATAVGVLGPSAILATGTILLLQHRIASVGIIVAFLMFHARLASPFSTLSTMPLQIAGLGVVAQRLNDVFSLEDERSGHLPFAPGDLVFSGVSVRRGTRLLLEEVSLRIECGEHVAICGPSGSGKSTLTTLVPRYFDPCEGSASIGGAPIASFDLASLRDAVALVSQEALVFDAPLRENLTYTNPSAGDAAIAQAIDICALDDVVARLPGGLEERLGQRGFRLSGGERQRLCVARALVQQPDILILDEALTGVDLAMERDILARIRERMHGRTLLVITHRVASIAGFDRVVTVEDGRIACIA